MTQDEIRKKATQLSGDITLAAYEGGNENGELDKELERLQEICQHPNARGRYIDWDVRPFSCPDCLLYY